MVPSSLLETGETRGKVGGGRIEALGNAAGYSVKINPGQNTSKPSSSFFTPFSGFNFALTPNLDVGIRIQWGAPFLLRAKYRFTGTDETKREEGAWSAAAVPAAGVTFGSFGVPDFSATYTQFGAGFVVSYRISAAWLVGPTLEFQTISFSGDGASLSGSVIVYGAHAQWEGEDLFIRLEPSKQSANIGGGNKSNYAFGLLGGIRF